MLRDGNALEAQVTPGQSVVVCVHGFCGGKEENGLFTTAASALRTAGLGSILYDWRGLGGSDGDFSQTRLDQHVLDFMEVVSWTRARLLPERLFVLGFSLGATLIGLAASRGCSADGAVYWSPALRPATAMYPRYASFRVEAQARGWFEKAGVRVGAAFLQDLRGTDLGVEGFSYDFPLLACHGSEDQRIPVADSRAAARFAGGQCRYVEFPGASHSFRPSENHWGVLTDLLVSWLQVSSLRFQAAPDLPLRVAQR